MECLNTKANCTPDQNNFWQCYDDMIHAFREKVGGYLNDMALSDKHFMDDSQLKHPSIGSGTKLVFIYHYLASKMLSEANVKATVMVTSGGKDIITVDNITHEAYNIVDTPKEMLFVIELPEIILYQVPEALFSLIHEICHIFMRSYTNVNDSLRCLVIKYMAWYLSPGINSYKMTLLDKTNFLNNSDELVDDFITENELLLSNLFSNGISSFLYKHLPDCMSNDVEVFLENILEFFIPHFFYEKHTFGNENATYTPSFFENVLYMYCESMRDLYKQFADYLKKRGSPPINFADLKSAEWQDNENNLKSYFCSPRAGIDYMNFSISHADFLDWERKLQLLCGAPYTFLPDQDINHINLSDQEKHRFPPYKTKHLRECISLLFDVEEECFADYNAIHALKMSISQYLMTLFLFKEGELSESISHNEETILRIGCVLEVAYQISSLEGFAYQKSSIIEEIDKKLNSDNHCDPRQINGEDFYSYVYDLLSSWFCSVYIENGIRTYLVSRLNNMKNEFSKIINRSVESQGVFKDIRDLYIIATNESCATLQNKLLDAWLQIQSI